MIYIHLVEELVEFGAGDGETSSSECRLQLSLVEFAVVIAVNTFKKLPELLLGMFNKDLELCIAVLIRQRLG